MDYYYNELSKLQDEFHEVIHDYPLFSETLNDIENHQLVEINELLEKNDEFYLKKAIEKLKDLISYIKNTSDTIKKQYDIFDKLAKEWEKVELNCVDDSELNQINDEINKANELIKSHDIKDLEMANQIMEKLLKYSKK